MEVSINAKSYAEAYAVVQMVNTSMSMFDGKKLWCESDYKQQ